MANDAALGRAVLELATDDTKFSAGLAEAKAQAGGLGPALENAGAKASTFGERLALLGKQSGIAASASKILESSLAQFTVAGLATTAITSLVGSLQTLITKGSELPAIQQSFDRLTSAVKINAGVMLNEMRRGTDSLVSDLDLMQSANKALLLGLPVTAASMGELANTARVLGKAMGQDATKSLDDLITALGRSSPMILDNLGLTVKVGEANEAYARKLGKSADALTDGEKKLAFYEAAMEAARVKTEQLGEQTKTLGEIATSVWVRVGNVITETAAGINTGLGASLSSGKGFIDFIDDVMKNGAGAAIQMAALREQIKAIDAARRGSMGKDVALESYESSLKKVRDAAASTAAAIVPLNAEQSKLALSFEKSGKTAAQIAEQLNKVQGWKVQEQAVKDLLEAHKKGAAEADKYTQSIAALVSKLSGADVAKSVRELATALDVLERRGPLTAKQMQAIGDEAVKLRDDGAVLTPRLLELAHVQDLLATSTANAATSAKAQDDAFKRSSAAAGVYLANLPTAIFQTRSFAGAVAQVSAEAAKYPGNLANSRRATVDWGAALENVASILSRGFGSSGLAGAAITAIGSIGQAMDAAAASTKKWGNSAGVAAPLFASSATGAQKAAAAVASGATIASGAMDVWAATSEKAGKAVGTLNGALAGAKAGSAFGPWGAAVGAAAGAVTGLVRALNDGRQAIQEFSKTFDTAAAGSGFDELHAKLLKVAGGEQLWIDATQKVGRGDVAAAKKAIDAINAALGDQDAWLQRLPGVLEKYGIAWEDAGQAVNQARLDEQAKQLIQDFADLSRAGVSVETITTKMSDSVNAYIQDAIRTGTEIPPAMRPLLEKMIELGTLTDANGNKITDLEGSGITFAQTMTEGFQSVVSAIKELTKALGGVPAALDAIPRSKTIDVEFRGRQTGYVPGEEESIPAIPMAGGGFGRVTRPTLFYSKGGEDYAFSGEGKSFGLGALASRPIEIHTTTELDGRVVARNQIRHTPDALARQGVRSR